MARHGRTQIVEVIEVDVARPVDGRAVGRRRSPGRDDGRQPDAPRPRPRWIAPFVVVAVATVVGVTVAVTSGPDHDAAPAATVAPSGTGSPLALPVLPLVPLTPAGYAITSVTPGSIDDAGAPSTVRELWATSTTSETSSWMEVSASPTADPAGATGDARVAVPLGIGVFDGQPQAVMTLTGPIPGGAATITSSGVSRAAVIALFSQLRLVDSTLVHDAPTDGGTFTRVAVDPDPTATGAPTRDTRPTLTVVYASMADPDQPHDGFEVTIVRASGRYAEATRRFFLTHARDIVVHGQQAVLGNDERTQDRQSVVFQRAGLQITIEGTAPRSVLLEAVDTIHVATGAELAAFSAAPRAAPTTSSPPAVEWTTFATGQLSASTPWTLRAGLAAGAITAIELGAGEAVVAPVAPVAPLDASEPTILTLASAGSTALVAFVPPGVDGARLVVTVDGVQHAATPVVVGDRLVAGFAFGQLSRYTAQILTADDRALSTTAG